MYRNILVPTDGSDISLKAKLAGGSVVTVSVKVPYPYSAISEMQPVPPQEFYDAQERVTTEWVNGAQAVAREIDVPCKGFTMEAVHPWEAIIEQAKSQNCDLIVMASHGRRGLSALLLGSETQRVLTHCDLPVLVVK